LQSRQALQELQFNQIKAAASPSRRLVRYEEAMGGVPETPEPGRRHEATAAGSDWVALTANSMTPLKRVPILANFEEWMKLATDNKINATNSWNFALIDYFHDMSLLREGESVNFQRASCTLDGCVKIYTSRVDSVATETGKLLSGLADTGSKDSKAQTLNDQAEAGGDDHGEDEDGKRRGATKKKVSGWAIRT
jgi:condensin complex subunit 2